MTLGRSVELQDKHLMSYIRSSYLSSCTCHEVHWSTTSSGTPPVVHLMRVHQSTTVPGTPPVVHLMRYTRDYWFWYSLSCLMSATGPRNLPVVIYNLMRHAKSTITSEHRSVPLQHKHITRVHQDGRHWKSSFLNIKDGGQQSFTICYNG